ncbi:hypothetical protein KUV80_10750 [Fictibacillus nanhaiensis]|uniref:hypothetical protein n=1 Tax=Fictibacillus nanhaiensis TaxID=742169 RepID=UPI001C96C9B8|nr:hypothetical protein [Fictibacillus nanhaiensis]MBY6037138.1 hypothetical protein [Fictibacillus nanhaiensis]
MKKEIRYFTVFSAVFLFIIMFSEKESVVQAQGKQHCYNTSIPLSPEEQRIEEGFPIPQQILEDSEFTQYVGKFKRDLCSAQNAEKAEKVMKQHGTSLWKTAVDRAQGKRPDLGDLDTYDDRPLYWARLHMTSALRQWEPDFEVTEEEREQLMKKLEYTSRGITSIEFPKGKRVKRILVSGFDPYRLEQEFRRTNPSGASGLQLDGQWVWTDDGPAMIQAANFPVRWDDFEEGIVEDTFGPYLKKGKDRVDLIMTISQGGPRKMAIEGFAGRWHTGADNKLENRSEVIPPVSHWPMPEALPEFIETTLPVEAMIDAETGPWPVFRNDKVCEWLPPNYDDPYVCHENGPTPESKARQGGGGSYLSNESQYRSNRVRIGLKAYDIPGGHLHIAAQEYYPEDKSVYITDEFKEFRKNTVDQTVALVKAAAKGIGE